MPKTPEMGLRQMKAAFEQLGTEVATRIGVAANRRAANRLKARFIEAAPYSERKSTVKYRKLKRGTVVETDYGHLRDNLKVRRVTVRTKGRISFQVSTGNAFWGYFLEFGTAKMQARPWMRPTSEAASSEILALQKEELAAGIQRALRRLERQAAAKG